MIWPPGSRGKITTSVDNLVFQGEFSSETQNKCEYGERFQPKIRKKNTAELWLSLLKSRVPRNLKKSVSSVHFFLWLKIVFSQSNYTDFIFEWIQRYLLFVLQSYLYLNKSSKRFETFMETAYFSKQISYHQGERGKYQGKLLILTK